MPMMNMSAETKRALQEAMAVAKRLEQPRMTLGHVLIGINSITDSTPGQLLLGYGIHPSALATRLKQLGTGNGSAMPTSAVAPETKQLIEAASTMATAADKATPGA